MKAAMKTQRKAPMKALSAGLVAALAGCGEPTSPAGVVADATAADRAVVDAVADGGAPDAAFDAALPLCANGRVDQGETWIDCGGLACPPCAPGSACRVTADCADRECINRRCSRPTCHDHTPNGSETDEDCGGDCPPCSTGQGCIRPADCAWGVCTDGRCASPRCDDGVLNHLETSLDCGGLFCPACPAGSACMRAGTDCTSRVCTAGLCQPDRCGDGVRQGGEACDDGDQDDSDGCTSACRLVPCDQQDFGPPVDSGRMLGFVHAQADYDLDDHPDLITLAGSTLRVLVHGPDGLQDTGRRVHGGGVYREVAVGNLDGLPGDEGAYCAAEALVFVSFGAAFLDRATWPDEESRCGILLADLTGDGRAELITAGGGLGPSVRYHVNVGERHVVRFARPVDYPISATGALAAFDFDGDGDVDLAAGHQAGDEVGVRLMRNAGAQLILDGPLVPTRSTPRLLRAGDVDGDGDLDVVVDVRHRGLELLRNLGPDTFASEVIIEAGHDDLDGLALVDLDRDGDLDVVWSAEEVRVASNDGTGRFGPFRSVLAHSQRPILVDLDGDQAPELVYSGRDTATLTWLPNRCSRCGDGRVTAPLETCDDGNRQGGDGCSDTCVAEVP